MSKAYPRSECKPFLLTDILLICISSVIFGLSITPGSPEVKFWGCNQCLSKTGQKGTEVMSRHYQGRKKAPTCIGVRSLGTNSHNGNDATSRAGPVLHQTSAALSRPMVNRWQLSVCREIPCAWYSCLPVRPL